MIKLESIKKLKESVDIIEIVNKYIPSLKRSGKNYFALCPFHSEKTPSFSIAPDKELIHCFGCGYTADIIKFVQDMEHINYYQAVEKIASLVNFKLEYINDKEYQEHKERYNEINLLTNLLTEIAEIYHEILLNSDEALPARNYLLSRGIKIETIKEFKIGFAPDDNYISKNYTKILQSKNKNYDLAALYKAGIINFKQEQKSSNSLEKYDHPYDYFRNRIMFPIFNFNGKVVGFGGRILPERLIDRDIPVYLNSAENILFNKGSILFGLYQAKEHIRKEKKVVVVEGYMDVLLLSQEGIKVVVAPLGTVLTQHQVNLLKKFHLERIYLLFDPDDAGVEAAFSASKNILEASEYPYVVKLDEEIDPDEYILKHGKEKMTSLIEGSTSIVKFIVDKYGYKEKSKLSVADKISLLKKFIELINVVTNPVIKSELIKEVAEELRIDENVVRTECKRSIQKRNNLSSFENLVNNRPYTCEEELLRICVHYPEFMEKLDEEIFSHDENYLDIFKKLKSIYLVSRDINEVLMSLNEANKDLVLKLVFDEKPPLDSLEKRYEMLCCEILRVKYKKRLKELKPIIDEMLEESKNIDIQILNEYKQILEILKTNHREKRYG